MNFYPFHIGDYLVHTRHLSLMEDLAYRRTLDLYYTREGALPATVAEVARLIGMKEREADVAAVLAEFFPEGRNKRADEEIASMRAKQENARASVAKRLHKASETQASRERDASVIEASSTNTNTNTNNQSKEKRAVALTVEDLKKAGLEEQTATDFLAHRKRKRAALTAKAWEDIAAEARRAGWTLEAAIRKALNRGWTGFEAEWVMTQKERAADIASRTVPARETVEENRRRLDEQNAMTPEQWEASRRAKALVMPAIKNITPKAA